MNRHTECSGHEPRNLPDSCGNTAVHIRNVYGDGKRTAKPGKRGGRLLRYVIDPEIVVIGGGMSKAGQYLLDVVFDHYRRYPKLKKTLCRFALADLGGDAGIYGAARLALDL